MRRLAPLLVCAAAACHPPAGGQGNASSVVDKVSYAAEPVTLRAADGVEVFGTHWRAQHPRALILLFHQAGSSSGEYASIGPVLARVGYDALAIDQRSGGLLFGANRTAARLGSAAPEGDAGYLAAYPDLQAALAWAETQKLPVILWGSSYSSSLIFRLAAAHPGAVRALLAFSPGEYFADPRLVRRAAAQVRVPVFVTAAPSAEEIGQARPIYDAVPGTGKVLYIPKAGVHGSSTLLATRNAAGSDANWRAVLAFLHQSAG